MSTATENDLTFMERNDPTVTFTIQTKSGSTTTAVNLTGKTVELYLKTGPTVADTDATVRKYTVGDGITVTDATAGTISVAMTWTDLEGKSCYHLDVLTSGRRLTHSYGGISFVGL